MKKTACFRGRGKLVHVFAPAASAGATHPVGVDYRAAAASNPLAYNPPETLPEPLALPGGMVECATCHTASGVTTGELVMDNTGSAICAACHRK